MKPDAFRQFVGFRAFLKTVAARAGGGGLDLLFPASCVLCKAALKSGSELLCGSCGQSVARERAKPACPTCARSVAPYEVADRKCGACRRRSGRVLGTARVSAYADNMARLVRMFKYKGVEVLGRTLSCWMADAVEAMPWLDRIEAIISVPTHWTRRLGRHFHAADVLASAVAARLEIPHLPVLRRVRGGPHQVGLSYPARQKNVSGAFTLNRGVTLCDARVLLIDDVKTTGATLEECLKVLRKEGAKEVYAAVCVTAGDNGPTGAPQMKD